MNKKRIKAEWETKTLGEVKGYYLEQVRVLEVCKGLIKDYAKQLIDTDMNKKYTAGRVRSLADSIKQYSKSIEEYEELVDVLKPIVDKKEAEGLNQAEYAAYMADNSANIKLLIHRVKELEEKALAEWTDWEPKAIKETHDVVLKELIFMLKDNVGTIKEIARLEYNNNRGMDGIIVGEKGTVRINTILAGGYNIQPLHYRTLINRN